MTTERNGYLAIDAKVVLDEIIMAKRLGNTVTLTFHLSKLSPLTTGIKEFLAALALDDEAAIATHYETIASGANELFETRQVDEVADDMVFVGEGKDRLISAISRATDSRTYVCQVDGPYRKAIEIDVPADVNNDQAKRAILEAAGDPDARIISGSLWRKRGETVRELNECDDACSYRVLVPDDVWRESIFGTIDSAKAFAQNLAERGVPCAIEEERTVYRTHKVRATHDRVSASVEVSGPMFLAASWS